MMLLVRALRGLARQPVRTGLSVAGIAVAAALLLDMVMLGGGLERSFEQLLLGRGFQVRLSPKGTLPFDTEATMRGVPGIVNSLRADPGIAEAGALVATAVQGESGDSLVPLVGYGVDPAGQGVYSLETGRDLEPGETGGVLIGGLVAERLGWAVGDTIRLIGRQDPQVATATRRQSLVVRGVVRWLYDHRGQLSVGASLPVMQELAGLPADRASVIMVRVAADSAVRRVTARLREAVPGVEVNSVEMLVAQFRMRVTYFRQLATILGTISLVVTVLLVGTLLMITVNERLGEIATLRVLGVARGRVVVQVLLEGFLLSATGAAIGTLLGLVTARQLDRILTAFPGLPAGISFFVPRGDHLLIAALVLLVAGTLAGAWPAWLAARAPLATSLREEGT